MRVHGKLGSVGRGSCVGVLRTGRRPIGTRWVDVNAGDAHSPEIRCWFVAQGVNTFKEDVFFAAESDSHEVSRETISKIFLYQASVYEHVMREHMKALSQIVDISFTWCVDQT